MGRTFLAAAAVAAALVAGPVPAAGQSWTSTGPGPPGVTAVAFDPTQPNVAYAGTLGGWLLRSTDAGASWTRVPSVPGDEPITSIAARGTQIILSRPGPVFSGAGDIVRSLDGGVTWASAGPAQGITNTDVRSVVIDPTTPNVVLLGTNNGLFRSVNLGATWSPVPVPTGTQMFTVIADPAVPGRFFAGSNSGVSRSIDHGASFSAYNQPGPVGTTGAYGLALDGATLYATQFEGTARTSTAGATAAWTDGSAGLPPGFFGGDIAVAPPRLIAAGLTMYSTALATPSWSALAGPGFPAAVLAADPFAPTRVLAGGGAGLARSPDSGQSWDRVDGALTTGLGVRHVAAGAPGSLLTGPPGTLLRSDDTGRTFQRSQTGLTSVGEEPVAVDPRDPQRMLVFGAPSQLFGSADGGRTWTTRTYGNSNTDGVLAFAPSDPRVVYGAGFTGAVGIARRSADGGATWTVAGLPTSDFNFASDLAVDAGDSRLVYLSTGSGVRVSSDGGDTWAPVSGIPAGGTGAAEAHPSVPGSAFVLTAGQLWRTSDRGATWTASVIPDGTPTDVVADPRSPSTVYVATTVGVFRSLDGGATWGPLSDGLPNRRVSGLALDRGGSALYAATDAGLAVLSFAEPSPAPPVPPGSPVATPKPGLASLRSARLRIDTRRRVALSLACPAASSGCAGTVRLSTRPRPASGRRRAVPAKTLATGRFSVRAGKRATVRLRLKRFPVRAGRTLKAQVRITGAGRSRTTRVTVRRPAARRSGGRAS